MKLHFIAAAAMAASMLPAHAALTNNPNALAGIPDVVDFESYDGLLIDGPEFIANGVVISGGAGTEVGAYIRDLGDNGVWGVGNHFAAAGASGELRFTFAQLQSGAGALLNHFAQSPLSYDVVVSAYDASHQLLESYTLSVGTGVESYNEGLFVGITRQSADIRSVSFSGVGLVADNLHYTTAVPEAEAYAMTLCGLGLLAGLRTWRRRTQA